MKFWNDAGQFTADVHLSTGSSFGMQRWSTHQGGFDDSFKWFAGDFDGDGKTDMMKLWDDAGQFTADVHLSTGNSFGMQRWATQQGGFASNFKWFVSDFNGDGRTDVMKLWDDAGQMTADVHLSTGSSFVMQRWATKQGGFSDKFMWFTGDFNGDGKTDIMKLWGEAGQLTADVHLSTGSSFVIQRWATNQGGFSEILQWFVGDFDGNGKTDIMKLWNDDGQLTMDVHLSTGSSLTLQRWATKQGGYSAGMKWFVGDFDGNGRTDIMKLWNDEGQFTADVHLSTGSSFGLQRWATKQGSYWDDMIWSVGDVNGDKKTDLIKLWGDEGQFTSDVHLSNGSSFGMQRWATKQGGFSDTFQWKTPDGYPYSLLLSADLIQISFDMQKIRIELFNSADEAATAAILDAWQRSVNEQVELGGYIFKKNGKYGFSTNLGNADSVSFPKGLPPGYEEIGLWHTHPSKKSNADLSNMILSEQDKRYRKVQYIFAHTPASPHRGGIILRYDSPDATPTGPAGNSPYIKEKVRPTGSDALLFLQDPFTGNGWDISNGSHLLYGTDRYLKVSVGPVSFSGSGQSLGGSFNFGPVQLGINTVGVTCLSVQGDAGFVAYAEASYAGCLNLTNGDLSTRGRVGAGAGVSFFGVGVSGSGGIQATSPQGNLFQGLLKIHP